MNYIKITKNDIANGVGVRVVLWLSGCTHHCKGCHNPETWNQDYGKEFSQETFNELCDALKHEYISGLTLSGGDPLAPYNRAEVALLIKQIKKLFPEKTIWLYSGYKWEEILSWAGLRYCDVVVDGEFEIENKDISLAFRGSKNQRIIDVRSTLDYQNLLKESNIVCLNFDNSEVKFSLYNNETQPRGLRSTMGIVDDWNNIKK